MKSALLLFDHSCSLCRSLAAYVQSIAADSLRCQAWQEFYESDQSTVRPSTIEIHLAHQDRILQDQEAWEWLLLNLPRIDKFGWMAQKLGLTGVAASTLNAGSKWLKRACLWCRPW